MKRFTNRVLLLLALGAVGAYVVHQRRQMSALERQQQELAASVRLAEHATPAQRIERDAVDALSRLAAVAGREADAPATPASSPQAASEGQDPPRAVAPDPAQYLAKLQSSFRAEAVDGSWDRVASDVVKSRLASDDRSVRSIECRTSMCRLVMADDENSDLNAKIDRIVGAPDDAVWSGAFFSRVEGENEGHPERVTYIFRKGVSLPTL